MLGGSSLHALGLVAEQDGVFNKSQIPLDVIEDHVPLDPGDAERLRLIAGELGVQTLREVLLHPKADARLAARVGLRDRRRITGVIATWVVEGTPGGFVDGAALSEDDVEDDAFDPIGEARPTSTAGAVEAPPAPWKPPPRKRAALRAWAEQHGIQVLLSTPISALPSDIGRALNVLLGGRGGLLTLEDLATSKDLSGRLGIARWDGWITERIARTTLRYLNEVGRGAALVAMQRRSLGMRARPPSEPVLLALRDQLTAARAALSRQVAERLPGTVLPEPMQIAVDPLRLIHRERSAFTFETPTVEIEVEGGQPQARCSCGARACAHQLTAFDQALDVLRDPDHPDRQKLADVLTEPSWGRFLRLFDRELSHHAAAPLPENHRLVWRILPQGGAISLEVLVQKLTKTGRWSWGQQISLPELARRPELLARPADARAFAALCDGIEDEGRGSLRPGTSEQRRIAQALDALREHEAVTFGPGRGIAARIERARLRILLEPASGGLRIAFALASSPAAGDADVFPLEAGRLRVILGGDTEAYAVFEERGLVLLLRVDTKVRVLVDALAREPVSFPPESHDGLLHRLGMLQEVADVALPPELVGAPIEADRRTVVRFTLIGGAGAGHCGEVELLVRPAAGGPTFPPGEGPTVVLHVHQGRRMAVHRDVTAERRRAAELWETLPRDGAEEGEPWRLRLGDVESMLDALAAAQERAAASEDVVVEWPDDGPEVVGQARTSALRIRVTEGRNWFGLEGDVEVGGERLPLLSLLDAVRRGRRYVVLGPRRFAAIHHELHRRLAALGDVAFQGRHGLEIGAAAAPVVAELVDEPHRLEAAARWRALLRRLDASRALEPDVPRTLTASLRPYQSEGFRWLCRLAEWGMGACLADDMGLGKTVQALAFLLHRASEGPALVIAPTSVGPNWVSEAERFAKRLRARLYRGAGREALLHGLRRGDLLVTSYALAVLDAKALSGAGFATLVLDEAQAIKNAATRRARAIRSLGIPIAIALTGTPVENHLGELWSVMRIVAPGVLGSWEQFRERFAAPIERQRDPARAAALARVIRPFLLRRTKAEVAPELPPRVEVARFVDLSAGERRIYDEARRAAIAAVAAAEEDPQGRFAILAAITRLRLLACHPRLVDEGCSLPSSKLAAFLDLVRELRREGHRALVFSQFTSHLDLVREALDRARITYEHLDGAVPADRRARRVEAFQVGRSALFLISLKAGGTGLNLTAADYVIHLDPWWNPAVEDQATDRAHRIGQTKPVTVIRLIVRATIEEAVVELHGDKRALAASIFDERGSAGSLSTRELATLIRAGEDALPVEEEESGDEGEETAEEAGSPAAVGAVALTTAALGEHARLPSDREGLVALVAETLADLARRREIADASLDATLRVYRRSLARFTEYVTANPTGSGAAAEAPSEVFERYLMALKSGRWPAPRSEPALARTVLNHLASYLASPQEREAP